MKLGVVIGGFVIVAREHGVTGAFSWFADRMIVRWYEWRLGIRSESVLASDALGLTDPNHRAYAPTDYRTFVRVMNAIPFVQGEDVFLDLGCGLGRAVVMAARRPFKRVLGVDIAAKLVEGARRNVERARARLTCEEVDIVEADAAAFPIPDDVTLVYMFNPFCGPPLAAVIANLRASVGRRQRLVRVICRIPERSQFESEIRRDTLLHLEREFTFGAGNRYLSFIVTP